MTIFLIIVGVIVAALVALAIYDLTQTRHAVLRNYPIVGHLRYMLESLGPELRQYIITANDAERPFSRDQRRWVYASAKQENNLSGFGTDNDLEDTPGYILISHATWVAEEPAPIIPTPGDAPQAGVGPDFVVPAACVIGRMHARAGAFRPNSIVNLSALSYGALGTPALEALNMGAREAGCWQNTGEGGLTESHAGGADIVFQIGTGYFGCRDADGNFSMSHLLETIARAPVKMIEVKLSQGAKPGHGGILPAAKVTPDVARHRGVMPGVDSITPASHSAFHDVSSMIDFIERLAAETGLPVGIKSAVGQMDFWDDLARAMSDDRAVGPDFITIDGGEGGTGAAPFTFADHVSLPFRTGFTRVRAAFAEYGIDRDVPFIGSARLGFPEHALMAFALGCDMVNVGREAMLAIGCIQAQRCHTGTCPTGVATTNPRLTRGLVPADKGPRLRHYLVTLRRELLDLAHTVGVVHPALVPPHVIELVDERAGSRPLTELYDVALDDGRPTDRDIKEITAIMAGSPVR